MGKAIEKIALKRGHEIVSKIDKSYNQGKLNQADVAINFSIPAAAVRQYNYCIRKLKSLSYVEQQVGWSIIKKLPKLHHIMILLFYTLLTSV
jgi:4-hydroxy-tetrahydrodipicolinate reductase